MTALYNEIDPKAAAWLRELIQQGHIAPGIVDERSIEDLDPEYLRQFTQVHFFAGIGVWSYALRRAGWRDDEPVWTGSCPCQPFSAAGKGGGFDDERHLWPAFHWLIAQCRPDVVLGEQVASKDGLAWFDLVSSDLEASGYAAGASDTCAAGFGAPHIRQRLYWCAVADATVRRQPRGLRERRSTGRPEGALGGHGAAGELVTVGVALGDAERSGLERHTRHGDGAQRRALSTGPVAEASELGDLALPDDAFWRANLSRGDIDDGSDAGRPQGAGDARTGGAGGGLGNPGHATGQRDTRAVLGTQARVDGSGLTVDGRMPFRSEYAGAGMGERPGPTNGLWRDADWLGCRDGKWRPVEPGTFPLAHGAPARVGRLRGYGNAIVAPQAQAFVEAVREWRAASDLC